MPTIAYKPSERKGVNYTVKVINRENRPVKTLALCVPYGIAMASSNRFKKKADRWGYSHIELFNNDTGLITKL